jgi:hypothetical protein
METLLVTLQPKPLRIGVIVGILLTAFLSFACLQAQSQTAQQKEQERQEKQREQQRQQQRQPTAPSENRPAPASQPRSNEPPQQQQHPSPNQNRPAPVEQPRPNDTHASDSPTRRTYSPSSPPPTVYTPHAASSGASTTSAPAGPSGVRGATVYTPHSALAGASVSGNTRPATSTPGTSSVRPSVRASTTMHTAYAPPAASSVASRTSNNATVLTPAGSERTISQVNTVRASMVGVNKKPLPAGQVTLQASGRLVLEASGGRKYGLRRNGTLASFKSAKGVTAKFAPNGGVRSVQTGTMKIQHGPRGGRSVVKQLPNHATLVSYGKRSGYLERTVVHNHVALVQRTYIVQKTSYFVSDTTYIRTFTPYSYRGVELATYAPGVYYAPEYYGWAYYPWAAAAAYTWGWSGEPWVGLDGSYFAPARSYASPALWMADYILGATLAAAYQEQQDFPAPDDTDAYAEEEAPADDGAAEGEAYAETSTPITPELRAEIAEEVRTEVAAENAVANNHASQQLSEVLRPGHDFVVATELGVSSNQGNCSLSSGDIIRVMNPTGSDSPTAVLAVAASKRGDCPAGAQVEVTLPDLQDMDNNLRAQAVASNQAAPEVQQLSEILQPHHFFVVAALLNVSSDQGNCSLTGGDIIGVVNPTGSDSQTAVLAVASSKRGDCPAGAQVEVTLPDLQDMDNNLRAQMDNALAKLRSEQGRGGLPAGPRSAIAPPPRPAMDGVPASPEPSVGGMLTEEQQQASQQESQVTEAAFANGPAGH